jgi:SH3-like domain-containing protein
MRRDVGELSLRGIEHRKERYVIFFPVTFAHGEGNAPPGTAAELSRDKVRLRAAPETGPVQARLRRGELLRLLERRDEWLRVRTADGLEGWVFAEAIESR